MAAPLTITPAPILQYQQGPPDWRAEMALRFSCVLTGAFSFAAAAVLLFLAALQLRSPNVLGLYPVAFSVAVLAAVADGKWMRCVGLGAVAGSVFMSTVGYAACLFIMARP